MDVEKLRELPLRQHYLYEGQIVKLRKDLVELSNHKQTHREIVEHPGGVAVAALTPEGELIMIRQYRYPYEKVLLEIPAGKLEKGEEPLLCGKRELLEETGITAQAFTDLGVLYPTPGYCNEVIHLYMATNLTFSAPKPDEDEFLEMVRIPFSEALQMVMQGEIADAKTQIAILKINLLLEK